MRLIPKNWELFQHYKDRSPPWIKLHKDLLNDRVFMSLPTASKALAPMLWLLASESKSANGEFDGSTEELEFRLRMPVKDIELGRNSLIHKGFFSVASSVLADSKQSAIPEERRGERETEKETETEPRLRSAPTPGIDRPEHVQEKTWGDFVQIRKAKKAPITETAMDAIRSEADKAGYTLEQALSECCARGWQGFKASWIKRDETESRAAVGGVNRQSALEQNNRKVASDWASQGDQNAKQ